jgi:CRISPR system Cascade subunit CasE
MRVSLYTVTYEGILEITDVELFKEVLTKGIGRGKAYGCGMLTIAR